KRTISYPYTTLLRSRVKKILVNDINKERELEINQDIITDNFKEIVEDEEIQLIVEVTSSIEEGYSYIKEGLNKGKDIVTANKAIDRKSTRLNSSHVS